MSIASHASSAAEDVVPGVVLDTNVVLAWLLFRDPTVERLAIAVESGAVRWLVTDAILVESTHMLRHPSLERWRHFSDSALLRCRQLAEMREPPIAPVGAWPRCSDPDDQMFIDLAISSRARWLISRDRAVLKLRRRLAVHGVVVVTPQAWTGPT